jgi:hypothetical protein
MVMPAIPPLNLSAPTSAHTGDFFGGSSSFGGGDWNVSTGSGQAGGLSTKTMLLAAGAGVLLWFLMRKKAA